MSEKEEEKYSEPCYFGKFIHNVESCERCHARIACPKGGLGK